ncbi:hypothetical protein NYZ99_00180 [Maribacter litopenaei]|uniref:Uncharacterized protein n=1 Tax=Maribacter litopenaei TaxID=2976127 RepID=A0ABY5Y9J9_9FLAO|nr:hypothetical protein [Maribacter litopenaei]UWX55110.1 hypothetical protein NYZ99_00180 [Maribacter litopenaei]
MTIKKQKTKGDISPIISGNNNTVNNEKSYKDGFLQGVLIGVIYGVITGIILYYLFG